MRIGFKGAKRATVLKSAWCICHPTYINSNFHYASVAILRCTAAKIEPRNVTTHFAKVSNKRNGRAQMKFVLKHKILKVSELKANSGVYKGCDER